MWVSRILQNLTLNVEVFHVHNQLNRYYFNFVISSEEDTQHYESMKNVQEFAPQ